MKEYDILIGTCVDNPFKELEILEDVIDTSREITKETFMRNVELDEDTRYQMRTFSDDFTYYSNLKYGTYFFTWSGIEYFYVKEDSIYL